MANKVPVVVGTIGAGYAATLHGNGYKKVNGVDLKLKGISDVFIEKAEKVKEDYGYEYATKDYHDLLNDPEINVIDIVTPPFLHINLVKEAILAGKNVICEKPLTGYFGEKGQENVGLTPKKEMYDKVMAELDDLKAVIDKSNAKFMFAENFVYVPAIQKAAEIVKAKDSRICFMKGEESLKGSSSPVAGKWSANGGGILSRTGCHPLGGILWLKQQEARARGEELKIVSVTCDTGTIQHGLKKEEIKYFTTYPEDVEDYGNITITFADQSKALIIACDCCLGYTKNYVEVYTNDSTMMCNITPTDLMDTYFLDENGLENVAISEMLPKKLGWNKAFVCDPVIRGYVDEMQNFCDTVAYDLEPVSNFELAYNVTKVLHAAYVAAEEGHRVDF